MLAVTRIGLTRGDRGRTLLRPRPTAHIRTFEGIFSIRSYVSRTRNMTRKNEREAVCWVPRGTTSRRLCGCRGNVRGGAGCPRPAAGH
ncbi:hypothetical protein GN956_G13787 [Arapaima gigas]